MPGSPNSRFRAGIRSLLGRAFCPLLVLALLALSCGPDSRPSPAPSTPAASTTATSDSLRRQADTQQLSRATPALANLIRAQPWFDSMTASELGLVAALVDCEKAAIARGEGSSVRELLQYASEQAWYRDGLDDEEARGLQAVVRAYARSLVNENAPPIGPRLAQPFAISSFVSCRWSSPER